MISVYYKVKNKEPLQLNFKTMVFDFDGEGDVLQSFRWVKISNLANEDLMFPTDQHVAKLLINKAWD